MIVPGNVPQNAPINGPFSGCGRGNVNWYNADHYGVRFPNRKKFHNCQGEEMPENTSWTLGESHVAVLVRK